MILRALTLHRPWATAIVQGPKRVENRGWAPPHAFPPGSLIAVHAGRTWDHAALPAIVPLWPEVPRDPYHHPGGVIVGLAQLERWYRHPGVATDPWACGPFCWVLGRVLPLLIPLPMRGAQGLWQLPARVERDLLAFWGQAT